MIIGTIKVRERGATPRGMAKMMNIIKRRAALKGMAHYFHEHLRAKRFTSEHGATAGYHKRKGEGMPRGSKQFRRSYTGKKLRKYGHTLPLVHSGESREAAKSANLSATATSNSTTARAAYPGLRKFNWRHPKSRINMALEFRQITKYEAAWLAKSYDEELDRGLGEVTHTEERTVSE